MRIGILVVAYNAASTLAAVLDRIPHDIRCRVDQVLVSDDFSDDSTYLVGLGYRHHKPDLPLTVVRQESNLGYGGNQKVGYRWAIDHGLDVVVLLHADGQYAPESLPELVAPLQRGEADFVLGSRMLHRGGARAGGMPLYKYVGNRILTRWENAMTGMALSEWHSGYRAYSVDALAGIPFESCSDGFDFDTQIILQLHRAGKRVAEVPIPTYYGQEISHVNGLAYARDVSGHTLRYRLERIGFGGPAAPEPADAYELKVSADSSHGRLLSWLSTRARGRVLDLGCSDGSLAAEVARLGHQVTGVDATAHEAVAGRVERFVVGDLEQGVPHEVGTGFDSVLCADVLEHVRRPERVLDELREVLAPGGSVLVSVPNFGHWYPRARSALGLFDYDRRGILDADHVRFFTRRSFERLLDRAGYRVIRRDQVPTPLEVTARGSGGSGGVHASGLGRLLGRVERALLRLRPTLFAYQFIYEVRPVRR